mgnify:CR=1 FL=1
MMQGEMPVFSCIFTVSAGAPPGHGLCPVGRGPRAPPKNAYPAAGHMGPALQVHTPQNKQRSVRIFPVVTSGKMWYTPITHYPKEVTMEKNTGKLFTPVHGTPMDYLRWRGDLTFRQDGFNEVDNLVLCII